MTSSGSTGQYASVTGDCGAAPTLTVKAGAQPASALLTEDICPGTGATVAAGATVTAHYTGIGLATGKVFDSSWQRGEPIQFPLTGVIAGWSEGIPGMKVGGRRLLVIPGDMAYGTYPPPGSGIEPDETLVFVVDIVSSP
ncbi:MAG: FKBP-type peptidyl-prolyl cis-trans isomerase [Actinobacteria bacterium]|nr:FKBP-type peptidyl-prolyl cis-trans isomerase [Actinomycetota bacterium]